MDILEKAKELGQLIAVSEEMTALKKAEADIGNDKKSNELLNEYKLLQIEMVKATKENRSNEIIESIKEQLLAKQDEINNYELTQNYIMAKANFDKLMKTMNDVIVFAITGEDPCSPHKCSSCGGGCK